MNLSINVSGILMNLSSISISTQLKSLFQACSSQFTVFRTVCSYKMHFHDHDVCAHGSIIPTNSECLQSASFMPYRLGHGL